MIRQLLSTLAVLTILCQIPAGAAALTENAQISTENQPLSIQAYEEDISLRSAQIKQFHFGVGGHIAAVYTDPIHYEDENGQWQEINNTLTLKQNDAELYSLSVNASVSYYENTANSFKVRLPNTFKENAQIHVDYLGNSISFAPIGMVDNPTANVVATSDVHSKKNALLTRAMSADTEAERKALIKESSVLVANQTSSLSYTNAYANAHLIYEINGQKLKESIILTAPTTQQSFSFAFTYAGLTPVVQEFGAVHFYDNRQIDGEPIFIIDAPYMEDANTQEDTLCMDIDVTVTPTATGCIYTMTPDAEWLNDPARVYPITIDPTLSTVQSSAAIQDNGVNQYNPTTNYMTVNRMYVGSNHDGSKAYESRIYIRFPRISAIPTSAFINKATMYLYRHETSSYQSAVDNIINVFEVGSYNWNTSSITWNSQKDYSFGSNPVAQTPVDIASSSGKIRDEYNVTSLVRKWYSTTASNNGLVLKPNTLDTTKTNRVCYYSSDYTVTGKMPHIEVEYFTGSETPGISDGAGYFIRNKYSNKYMEVKNSGGTGSAIIQSSFDGAANQQWRVNYESGGVYSFSPMHNTNLKLDVINATDANGQNTQAFVDTGYSAQLFRIYSNGDGTYRIISAISETRALDIEGPSTANGAAVQIWTWDSTANQMKWYFERVEASNCSRAIASMPYSSNYEQAVSNSSARYGAMPTGEYLLKISTLNNTKVAAIASAYAVSGTYPVASEMLIHFLNNSGELYTLPSDFIKSSAEINSERQTILNSLNNAYNTLKVANITVSYGYFDIEHYDGGDNNTDWKLAVNKCELWGKVTADGTTSKETSFYVRDFYDWEDNGKITFIDIASSVLNEFHYAGIAKEYPVLGIAYY